MWRHPGSFQQTAFFCQRCQAYLGLHFPSNCRVQKVESGNCHNEYTDIVKTLQHYNVAVSWGISVVYHYLVSSWWVNIYSHYLFVQGQICRWGGGGVGHKRFKLSVRYCKLLNYLKWNLGSAQIDDNCAIWDLRADHYRAVCAGLRNALTPDGPETTVKEVSETEQVKRSIFKMKLCHVVMVSMLNCQHAKLR